MAINSTSISLLVSLLFILFFAGMEVAFLTANRLNIELRKKQGRYSGKVLLHFMERPFRLPRIANLGLVVSLIVYGLLFQDIMKQSIWNPIHLSSDFLANIFNYVVGLLIILFFGMFLSRLLFNHNDRMLYFFSPVILFFESIFQPVLNVLVSIAKNILIYLFNVKTNDLEKSFSAAFAEKIILRQRENVDDSPNKVVNTSLFENALSLASLKIKQCYVPRTEIVAVSVTTDLEAIRKKFIETNLSKLVVYDGNFDNIVGYINQLDLFKKKKDLQAILLPIFTVPEAMNAIDLMARFSKERKSMAWVIDEYGGTAGIITMEDILEEIFGDIKDENDASEMLEKRLSDDEFVFSGRIELDYLRHKYEFQFLDNQAETLSGYIINQHKSIPLNRDHVIIGKYAFDILSVSQSRIETVKMKILH